MLCTLLVPDLFLPRSAPDDAYRDLALPALERLLARASRTPLPEQGHDAWLCQAFGVAPQPDWPVAPLSLAADGGDAAEAFWLRADPVHLRATRDRVALSDASLLAIRPDEAEMLVAAINAYFADDTRQFFTLHPERWYLRLAGHPQIATRTLIEAIGKDINPLLPAGPQALHWHRVTNEMQMLLHAHTVNEAREERGELTINSVWLWGGGIRPAVSRGGFHAVWGDYAFVRGLGQSANLPSALASDGARELLESTAQQGRDNHHLIVLDQLVLPARHGDLPGWRAHLERLEHDWFAPLLDGLRRRRVARVAVVALGADRCTQFEVTRRGLLQFWRGATSLAAYAGDQAR
jgi:hypothetical protein